MLDDLISGPALSIDEVLLGLNQPQKSLPSKLFYDAEGCRLFGEITRLPEYYVTRVELDLLRSVAPSLTFRPGTVLVEYGGSDESKASMVFDHIGATSYVPIDVAASALSELADRLHLTRPELQVAPLVADFLSSLELPPTVHQQPRFGFFPGSTIGNLDPAAATDFLRQARATLGIGAQLLVGVDLRKDPAILIPAYDDAAGVTAAFNRNILHHVNRLSGSNFDMLAFDHRAIWNDDLGRMEMHLVSRDEQVVTLCGQSVRFRSGETIHTECSYKHTIDGFASLAREAGWHVATVWTDPDDMFSLHLLDVTENRS